MGIQTQKKRWKIFYFGALFAVLLQTVAAPVALAVEDDDGPGGGQVVDPNKWDPKNLAKRWAYLNALRACVKESSLIDGVRGDRIDPSDAEDGKWFKNQSLSSYQFAPGYIDTEVNEDGKAQCNDIVKLTAPMYGVSYLQMLCMFDAKREDGSSCLNSRSSGDDARFKDLNYRAFDPAIAFGSAEYKNSDAGYYLLNYAAFTSPNGCNAALSPSPGGEDFTYTVNYVNGQSLVEGATFTGLKKDQNITVYVSNPNLINQNRDCSVIAADLSRQAAAYAKWFVDNPDGPDDDIGDGGDRNDGSGSTGSVTTCAIEGVGWIFCPVFKFLAEVTDDTYEVVDDFLEVEPITTSGSGEGLYNAWSAMRNIANVAFIIAFMMVIYSQLTGAGVSNYGIKKLLPKIILSAILVNISFWVCAVLVDLSNIAGGSLKSLMETIGGTITGPNFSDVSTGGEGFVGLATAVLAGTLVGVGLYLGIGALLMALPLAVIAIFTAFVVLIIRQAAIIMLVVVSPLAFVAYLLPNTESWFKKWLDLFKTMLFMYPLIALAFGGAALASQIIMQSAEGSFTTQLLGAMVAVVPLLITPLIMKTAGGLVGGIANGIRKSGLVQGAQKGMQNRADRTAGNIKANRDIRAMAKNDDGTFKRRMSFRRGGLRSESKAADIKKLRDATFEDFGNTDTGSALSNAVANKTNGRFGGKNAKTAREAAVYAQETAKASGEELTSQVKERHLNENGALHRSAFNASKSYGLAHDTEQKEFETDFINANISRYNALDHATDENATAKAEQKTDYLSSATGTAASVARKNAEKASGNADLRTTMLAKQSQAGRTAATTEKGFNDKIKTADSEAETDYLASPVGSATRIAATNAGRQATVSGKVAERAAIKAAPALAQAEKAAETELKIAHNDDSIAFEESPQGQAFSQVTQRQDKELKSATTDNQIAFETSVVGQALSTQEQAQAGELELAKADNTELYQASDAGMAQSVQLDASRTQADVTKSRQSTEALSQNSDINLAARAAQSTNEAKKAEEGALFDEIKTQAGADSMSLTPEQQAIAHEAQNAETQRRVQSQRSASAGNVGTVEYAERLTADPALAKTAGGIDPRGTQAALAAASRTIDEQLDKSVRDEKSTLSSHTPLDLENTFSSGVMKNGQPASTEHMMAVAGKMASSGYMGGKLALLRGIGTKMRLAKNAAAVDIKAKNPGISDEDLAAQVMEHEDVKKVTYIQKQISEDLKGAPFGTSSRMLTELAEGSWDGDFDGEYLKRLSGKTTDRVLDDLKSEEFDLIKELDKKGRLEGPQREAINRAISAAAVNPNLTLKPEVVNALESMGFDVSQLKPPTPPNSP